MPWIDKVISWISPARGLRRFQTRKAIELLRAYEGAGKGRRTQGWKTPSTSSVAEIAAALPTLRNRSRDLVRNNPYAARGIDVIANNVVGKGIIPYFTASTPQRAERFRNLWRQWAESTTVDQDGLHNIYGLQSLAMRSIAESGEVLVRRIIGPSPTLPLKLQLLEGDFICPTLTRSDSGNPIIQGIEFDADGKRVAYYLYKEHPGNQGLASVGGFRTNFSTVRVPAEEITHVYRIDRPGQVRGVPWLSPVIIRLRDFDEYEDAQLVRQKISQCFSVFVCDIETPDNLTMANKAIELGEQVEPGMIELLPPGKDIKFATPPSPGESFKEYSSVNLHAIAAGLGVTYEAMTGDLAEINFSSGRMGWIEFSRNIDAWRYHILKTRFCDPVIEWFKMALFLSGESADDLVATWTPPRREMIDPTKEVPAKIKSIRGGLETLSDSIRQMGKHPQEHLAEMKADNALLDSLGLVLDSDARKVGWNGDFQQDSTPTE